ncbi:cysteine desulfurase / selenocysteine lyase [Actinobaculum suis]|uniref:Cysteine desulfurase n=1 Tax=Actinobaculum suis TaxID=1657 RepID=A0A1G7EAD7_9ACTO|nr:SufS family cysteine desulfurase [Actinobaculum suis]MDY5153031.1 SufS family cysteine desulfurase [Actinobaculum suis]SDE60638.1 cysteine desulfurase / selenocysteine lyase [Actinobaculum suis]
MTENDGRLVPRADFPILAQPIRGEHRLVYLDSGATAQQPRAVSAGISDFVNHRNGGVKRGSHQLAEESTVAYEEARQVLADFVGAGPEEIVWTHGSTESLNLLAYAFSNAAQGRGGPAARRFALGPGDSVVATVAEHHANLVPWQELCARTGAEFRWLGVTETGRIDLDTLKRIDKTTRVVAITHVSNVTGAVTPVAPIVEHAHRHGALVVLDACQSVPHMPVNFAELGVDFAAFSGHKMYGPTGVGALYGRAELLAALPPFLTGGSMVAEVRMEGTSYAESPARFEAGTQPVQQIVGLALAVKYLQQIGMDRVAAHEEQLTALLLAGLREIPGVRVLGPLDMRDRAGIVAVDVAGVHPHDVGQFLDSWGIAVRTGHHCAQPIHQHFGVGASTRASLGIYNTAEDVHSFLESLGQVRRYFKVA